MPMHTYRYTVFEGDINFSVVMGLAVGGGEGEGWKIIFDT